MTDNKSMQEAELQLIQATEKCLEAGMVEGHIM